MSPRILHNDVDNWNAADWRQVAGILAAAAFRHAQRRATPFPADFVSEALRDAMAPGAEYRRRKTHTMKLRAIYLAAFAAVRMSVACGEAPRPETRT